MSCSVVGQVDEQIRRLWEPVLDQWVQILEEWHEYTNEGWPPFAYNERALLSGVAGGIWRAGI